MSDGFGANLSGIRGWTMGNEGRLFMANRDPPLHWLEIRFGTVDREVGTLRRRFGTTS